MKFPWSRTQEDPSRSRPGTTGVSTAVPRARSLDALHVALFASFAVSQPIFDRLAERAQFLVDKDVKVPAIVLITLLVGAAIPAIPAVIEWLSSLFSRRAQDSVHALWTWLFATLVALPIAKRITFVSAPVILAAAFFIATAFTWAYFRFQTLRTVVTVASPALLLFPVSFLFFSPVKGLLFPPRVAPATGWNPVPVVMVVFDEFCGSSLMNESGEIDADRFPNFAKLARQSTWFCNASSVHPDTPQAVPALLSGNYAGEGTPPILSQYPQNLFTLLDSTGKYDFSVFEPVTNLCPEKEDRAGGDRPGTIDQIGSVLPTLGLVYLYHLTPEDLYERLPKLPFVWFGIQEHQDVRRDNRRGVFRYRWGQDRAGQVDHFLDCLSDSESPTIFFQHVLLPHVPWCYLPSGKKYVEDGTDWDLLNFNAHGFAPDLWGADELFVIHSQQRHLLQLQFADRQIGRLLDRLAETGLYDKCLLVVTADHGVSFRVNLGRRMPDPGNLADIMSIPLFIKRPGQTAGEVNDRNVETIDILPSIASVLDMNLPEPVRGHSVFDAEQSVRDGKTMFHGSEKLSMEASILPANQNTIALRQNRFGSGPDSLFRIGPRADFVGRLLSDFSVSDNTPFELELTRFGDTLSDDPKALIPCHFEGRVRGLPESKEPIEIAVVIDGTICAVTRTYLLDGLRDTWTALVPEEAFRLGKNDVQFFRLTGTGDDIRLSLCRTVLALAKPEPSP